MRVPVTNLALLNARIGGTDPTGYVPPGTFASGPGEYLPIFTPLLDFSPEEPLQTWQQEYPYAFGTKMWQVMPGVFLGTPSVLLAQQQVAQPGGNGPLGGVSPNTGTQAPTGTTSLQLATGGVLLGT